MPPEQFAQFRAWFEQFDAARFNQQIERDAVDGNLDRLADEAIEDLRSERARQL